MTTETRLDVATLKFAIDRVRKIADEMNADACGAMEAGQRAHHDALDFYVDEFRRTINYMIDLAGAAESAPPRLSDWARACEGVCDGQPADLDWAGYQVAIDCSGASVRRWSYDDSEDWIECSTPAELRAALEALARPA